jgi:ATP-dependent protease ClpP protease subunit
MKRPLHVFNYSVKNQSNGECDIYIDGDIVDAETQAIMKAWFGDDTSTSYKSFRNQLNSVEATTYNVYVNSGGGLVTDAMAIHDLLKDLQANGKTVNTKGRGLIGSAATYILMAGNTSEVSKNSWVMIHNVSGAVYGDVNDVERYATTLRKFNNASRDFYSDATGIRKEDITKMMNEETWMTGTEAKEKGFVKNVTGEATFSQTISKENCPFTNMAVLNSYNAAVKPVSDKQDLVTQKFDEMKKFLQDLGKAIMQEIKGVKAPENNDHTALMSSIGEAVSKSFEAAAGDIEKVVNDAVAEGIKSGVDFTKDSDVKKSFDNALKASVDFAKDGEPKTALEAAVKTAVENATKPLTDKITALEGAKTELEKDITALKGKGNVANDGGNTPKVSGKFS